MSLEIPYEISTIVQVWRKIGEDQHDVTVVGPFIDSAAALEWIETVAKPTWQPGCHFVIDELSAPHVGDWENGVVKS